VKQRQLTREVAERCARACKYKLVTFPKSLEVWKAGKWQMKDAKCWVNPQEQPCFSSVLLDPYFWRPRLEDRFFELAKKKYGEQLETAEISSDADSFLVSVSIRCFVGEWVTEYPISISGEMIESILCEAIEKLTEVQIGSKSGPAAKEE